MIQFYWPETGQMMDVDINPEECLKAYFLEKTHNWNDIFKDNTPRFGKDSTDWNMRRYRQTIEWIEIVTKFANANNLNVQKCLRKAIFKPRAESKTPKIGMDYERVPSNGAEDVMLEFMIEFQAEMKALATRLTDETKAVNAKLDRLLEMEVRRAKKPRWKFW